MPFASGSYTRTDGVRVGTDVFQQQQAAALNITDTLMDAHANDIATALSTCLLKDGTQTVTANVPFAGFKITNLGIATTRTDAASLANIQDNTSICGGTSGGSANAQTLTLAPAIPAYVTGQTFWFTAGFTNTGAMTMDINSVGATSVRTLEGDELISSEVRSGEKYGLLYNGTHFILIQSAAQSAVDWSPTYGVSGTGSWSGSTNHAYYKQNGHWIEFSLSASGSVTSTPSALTFTTPTNVSDSPGGGASAAFDSTSTKGAFWARTAIDTIAVFPFDRSGFTAGTRSIKVDGRYKVAA